MGKFFKNRITCRVLEFSHKNFYVGLVIFGGENSSTRQVIPFPTREPQRAFFSRIINIPTVFLYVIFIFEKLYLHLPNSLHTHL